MLGAQAEQHRLRILGYCLMPNHIHAVVVPEHEDAMAQGFGRTHNAYSRHLNKLRKRSGHLWQNRYYSAPLDPGHLVRALRYVDLNPVRARLVDRAADYPWSSARAHAGGADSDGLLDLEFRDSRATRRTSGAKAGSARRGPLIRHRRSFSPAISAGASERGVRAAACDTILTLSSPLL